MTKVLDPWKAEYPLTVHLTSDIVDYFLVQSRVTGREEMGGILFGKLYGHSVVYLNEFIHCPNVSETPESDYEPGMYCLSKFEEFLRKKSRKKELHEYAHTKMHTHPTDHMMSAGDIDSSLIEFWSMDERPLPTFLITGGKTGYIISCYPKKHILKLQHPNSQEYIGKVESTNLEEVSSKEYIEMLKEELPGLESLISSLEVTCIPIPAIEPFLE